MNRSGLRDALLGLFARWRTPTAPFEVSPQPTAAAGPVGCPNCRRALDFQDVFRTVWCWSGADVAVVGTCAHCGDPLYFSPRPGFIEWGMLGGSPRVDPIPMARYAVEVSCRRQGEWIEIGYGEETRRLPSARLHAQRHRAAHSYKNLP